MVEILKGDLKRVRLPSLLQLLESEALTGWLGVSTVGGVAMSEGRVVQAAFGQWSGTEALFELFLESEGSFRVEEWEDVPGDALGQMLPIVMEGCRMMDEWSRIQGQSPVWRSGQPSDVAAPLQPLTFDGSRTLHQLTARHGIRRTSIIDPILLEVQQRRLDLGSLIEPSRPSSAPKNIDYYQAMDQGRHFLLGEAYEAAEKAFMAALEARPGDRLARQQLNRALALRNQQST